MSPLLASSESGAFAYVFAETGDLEACSPGGERWVDHARAVAVEHREVRGRIELCSGVAVVTPLRGEGVHRTLVVWSPGRPADPCAGLSPRCREVAGFLAVGATIEEVARHLSIRPSTVREYRDRIYRALGVASRVELAERLRT